MRRRLNPDDRRKEILRVAARTFAARPYDEVHLDAIAAEAEASRGLLNHYFGDKRGLFLAVVRMLVESTPQVVRTDLELSGEEMVAANTTAWLDFVEAGKETFLTLLGSGPLGRDPQLEALGDELRDRLATRMLENHFGSDGVSPVALAAMRGELGLVERAIWDWINGRGGDRAQTHALIVESILATVQRVIPALLEK